MISHLVALLLLCSTPLKVGDTAPDFTVADIDGTPQHLADLVHSGTVVLAFFPKAFTPGCTQELTAYQGRAPRLKELSVHLLAISSDDADTLKRFKSDLKAPYTFIPDSEGKLIEQYGIRQWPLKMAKRTTFVINDKRAIVRIDEGSGAIDPTGAIESASPKKP